MSYLIDTRSATYRREYNYGGSTIANSVYHQSKRGLKNEADKAVRTDEKPSNGIYILP